MQIAKGDTYTTDTTDLDEIPVVSHSFNELITAGIQATTDHN